MVCSICILGIREVSGPLEESDIIFQRACLISGVRYGELRIFDRPDTTCSEVTTWRFLAQQISTDTGTQAPEIQIWQEQESINTDGTSFGLCARSELSPVPNMTTLGSNIVLLQATASILEDPGCHECRGKVGVYLPQRRNSQFDLLYRKGGPVSYFMTTNTPVHYM